MHVLLQYQSKSYYIIGQEVYYSIGRFYYIIGQLLQYRAFLLHYRAVITVSGVYYIIGWYRCHCGLCRTSTAVASRLQCDGGSTTEARRNMLKVSAVPSQRSAVLTVFRGATAINDVTTAEPRRSWRCHCGLCRISTAVVPGLRCDGGITLKFHIYQ